MRALQPKLDDVEWRKGQGIRDQVLLRAKIVFSKKRELGTGAQRKAVNAMQGKQGRAMLR
jgi:hypothetical protein